MVAADAVAQDFRSGRSAINISDYQTALAHWPPLAGQGDAKSQASLGYLHYMGLGVSRDYVEAARWYRKAAEQNQIDALYILGNMYLFGHGLRKDPVKAYVLCEIALSQGEAKGLPCRDNAQQSLTREQIKIAQRRVSEWHDLAEKDRPMN